MSAVLIAGPPGAETVELAGQLRTAGAPTIRLLDGDPADWPITDDAAPESGAAVLALDLTTAAGEEERSLLCALADRGLPVALVGVGAGQDEQWPGQLAALRRALDPQRRLPVFAIALEAARAGDADRAGVPALARWCRAPDTAPPDRQFVGASTSASTPRTPKPAQPPSAGGGEASWHRTERQSGARVGFARLRAQTSADIRAGAAELGRRVDAAGPRRGGEEARAFQEWLTVALHSYTGAVTAELRSGIAHVCAVALVGLPGDARAIAQRGSDPDRPSPSARAPRAARATAEDCFVLALGASAGLGLGRVAVGPLADWAGLGAVGGVLTVLVGVGGGEGGGGGGGGGRPPRSAAVRWRRSRRRVPRSNTPPSRSSVRPKRNWAASCGTEPARRASNLLERRSDP